MASPVNYPAQFIALNDPVTHYGPIEYLNSIYDLLKNIPLGKEGYFYIFGSEDCDYAMGDVSNQDNTIEEVTPKCMDVITEKKDFKSGRSDTV